MKTLFENYINKIDLKRLMKDIFINASISALILSFISFLIWKKLNLNLILILTLVLILLKIFQALKHNYRNHLERISIDYKNEKIIINHTRPSIKKTDTIMNFKEIQVSDIKSIPISWFSLENYFWISDKNSKIKISTAGHKNREIDLNEIYFELNNIKQVV